MDADNEETDYTNLDVLSTVSCRRPIDPNSDNFDCDLAADVNKLVTVANTHKHTFTCYIYGGTHFFFYRQLSC